MIKPKDQSDYVQFKMQNLTPRGSLTLGESYVPSFMHWAWDSHFCVPSHVKNYKNGVFFG